MKAKRLLLIMLALLMCGVQLDAQTKKPVRKVTTQVRKNTSSAKPTQKNSREYKVEDDGFEWYLVCKNGKYGAESRDGRMLVPTEYTNIVYFEGFHAYMGEYSSYYNTKGKCIIPYNRHYNKIFKFKTGLGEKEYDVFIVHKGNERVVGEGLCDINGKEIIYLHGMCHITPYTKSGLFYFEFNPLDNINIVGIADGKGNVIISPTEMTKEPVLYDKEEEVFYSGYSSKEGRLAYIPSSNITYNPLLNSFETASSLTSSNSVSSSNSSNNSTSTSNNNSGGGTTTIHVEHHRDPVPVQEWVQCTSCWGSGNCRNCAGSGTIYIGSNLHRCTMCGGRGKCTTCSGQGGRNQTVYR